MKKTNRKNSAGNWSGDSLERAVRVAMSKPVWKKWSLGKTNLDRLTRENEERQRMVGKAYQRNLANRDATILDIVADSIVPSMDSFNINMVDFVRILGEAYDAGWMKEQPRNLTDDELLARDRSGGW